ncbi:preprotein translocase subunit SecA [Chromatiales bacterium (ex Bugula neritina AB1)]|nr:preprotein translocase subunit SecA [Chromatiales bacterium (ex Bugula neritina AB1)]
MIGNLVKKIIGSRNDRLVKQYQKTVLATNQLTDAAASLSDEQLKAKTDEFKSKLADGASLEDLMPEAFSVVREAGARALGMRHYDVQLIGGSVLHDGKIAEMRTGEGKTLVATAAVYLNALAGKGVHVVTVNDYLAQRDSEWMGKLYNFLGLSVGVIIGGLDSNSRREAYSADVTYGTNNEFGFDYLRDNMALTLEDKVQRGLHYAIVDEVDSILIDEARTPLIISGPTNESSETYARINNVVPSLVKVEEEDGPGDFTVDEKAKQVHLTETGMDTVEQLLVKEGMLEENESLYDPAHISILHHLNAGLRSHAIYKKDIDYIVSDGQIVIVDEFTGRTMAGRRWSDGLHQAIEAKEKVTIQQENQTLASITYQNYFRLYDKLAGMTGTADTEAFEFQSIYNLEVVVIPTNKSMVRDDRGDLIYLTQREKYDAIVEDIEDCVKRRQPTLVGTTSIETSEYLSGLLKGKGIAHEVLNAKQHEREAQIIADAGRPGAVTIATNMAGRGTDIVLGGNLESELAGLDAVSDDEKAVRQSEWESRHAEVLASGGLHIIGTERHESRRIDNQLRGRSGRQGDAGSSRFYLSLEDNLMRIFASERIGNIMQKLGMEEGEAIEHSLVTRAIENAQRKVEGHNFDIRKHLLEYDDVANDQRKVIYEQRDELIEAEEVSETVAAMRGDAIENLLNEYIPPGSLDDTWDLPGATQELKTQFDLDIDVQALLDEDSDIDEERIRDKVVRKLTEKYQSIEAKAGGETLRRFEKFVLLKTLDDHWKEHLASMDYLRQSVGLRGYAQKNPKQEYKRESFELFSHMLDEYKKDVVGVLSKVQVQDPAEVERAEAQAQAAAPQEVSYQHAEAASATASSPPSDTPEVGEEPFKRDQPKVGRNDPCWCGSGKKFKRCHGKLG